MLYYWQSQGPIVFYGKVVDQAGQPIGQAVVTVKIDYFKPSAALRRDNYLDTITMPRTTDANGEFHVDGVKGRILHIARIECPGYVTVPEKDWHYERFYKYLSFRYAVTQGNPVYVPDPRKPAIFPLRRPDEPRTLAPDKGGSEKKVWKQSR